MRGRVGALCLSWSGCDSPGIPRCAWPITPPPGQAQGPHIHPTPPLVPTGGRGRKRPNERDSPIRSAKIIRTPGDGVITVFGCQSSKIGPLSIIEQATGDGLFICRRWLWWHPLSRLRHSCRHLPCRPCYPRWWRARGRGSSGRRGACRSAVRRAREPGQPCS
jgi:hypothetical protein